MIGQIGCDYCDDLKDAKPKASFLITHQQKLLSLSIQQEMRPLAANAGGH